MLSGHSVLSPSRLRGRGGGGGSHITRKRHGIAQTHERLISLLHGVNSRRDGAVETIRATRAFRGRRESQLAVASRIELGAEIESDARVAVTAQHRHEAEILNRDYELIVQRGHSLVLAWFHGFAGAKAGGTTARRIIRIMDAPERNSIPETARPDVLRRLRLIGFDVLTPEQYREQEGRRVEEHLRKAQQSPGPSE